MPDPTNNGRVRDAVIETKLDILTVKVDKVLEDHEGRLRALERKSVWGNVKDAAIVIGAALGIAGTRA